MGGGKAWDENESRERRLKVRRGVNFERKEIPRKEGKKCSWLSTKQVNNNTIGNDTHAGRLGEDGRRPPRLPEVPRSKM